MNFLIPYMKDRPRSSNISGDGESTSPLNETQHEVYDEPENVHDNSSDNDDDDEHVFQLTETPSTKKKLVGSKDETLEFLKEQARKREERSEIRQRTRDALLQPVNDSLKLFFDSMYEATKILPLPNSVK
ncbi:hypothetical protein JTB14_022390 [Gonioctena quinquepunctata]|nr:hypothetical protein JTB14_022390 [Gonioctena quinquepunctata]